MPIPAQDKRPNVPVQVELSAEAYALLKADCDAQNNDIGYAMDWLIREHFSRQRPTASAKGKAAPKPTTATVKKAAA